MPNRIEETLFGSNHFLVRCENLIDTEVPRRKVIRQTLNEFHPMPVGSIFPHKLLCHFLVRPPPGFCASQTNDVYIARHGRRVHAQGTQEQSPSSPPPSTLMPYSFKTSKKVSRFL